MIEDSLMRTAIWESAKETFETMVFLPIEEIDDTTALSTSLMVCSLTYNGQLQGCLLIYISPAHADKIARGMLMSEPDDKLSDEDICDALGEVVNMIMGGVKARLHDLVSDIQLSVPSTIMGNNVRPSLGKTAKRVAITTGSNGEVMKLSMVYREAK